MLGRSERGRPIMAIHAGDPNGLPVLVVGCIHGNECAGIPVARALERVHTNLDLWVVPNLNPDGYAAGTRQNGRGVDLNRNWSSQWPGGGHPWATYYPGPHPFSVRETRIARNLILRVRPRVTIWFHQHMNLVWAWGQSSRAGRIYAHAAGMRFYHQHWLDGHRRQLAEPPPARHGLLRRRTPGRQPVTGPSAPTHPRRARARRGTRFRQRLGIARESVPHRPRAARAVAVGQCRAGSRGVRGRVGFGICPSSQSEASATRGRAVRPSYMA